MSGKRQAAPKQGCVVFEVESKKINPEAGTIPNPLMQFLLDFVAFGLSQLLFFTPTKKHVYPESNSM